MPKVSEAYPSKWLKAADLGGREVTVAVSHVDMESIGDDEMKPVLYFKGKQKGLVLNKTNAGVLAARYGDEMNDWQGKPVVLFTMDVQFQGQIVPALRVRIPAVNNGPEEEPPF